MEKHKKKVIFIIGFILVIISVLVIALDRFYKSKEEENKPNPPVLKFNTEISILNDYNEFFTVNQIINQYYQAVVSSDNSLLLSYLDPDYIAKNNVTAININDKIKRDFASVSFTTTEIYYNKDSVITYYFVNGFLEDVDPRDDSVQYYKNIMYMVIVDKNKNTFIISPVTTNGTIEEYANSYPLEEKIINNNAYRLYNTIEENVLQTYLMTFQSLLFLDNKEAYDMLDSDTKSKYLNYEDFLAQVENIYDSIGTKIFGYAKKEENGGITYRIVDDKERHFTIYETRVMDFKIAY